MTKRLSQEEIQGRLASVAGWELVDDIKIQREWEFADFQEAMDFVSKVAILAEQADHHPDIHISYKKVRLELSTHSAGGLTEKDFEAARKIDMIEQPV